MAGSIATCVLYVPLFHIYITDRTAALAGNRRQLHLHPDDRATMPPTPPSSVGIGTATVLRVLPPPSSFSALSSRCSTIAFLPSFLPSFLPFVASRVIACCRRDANRTRSVCLFAQRHRHIEAELFRILPGWSSFAPMLHPS